MTAANGIVRDDIESPIEKIDNLLQSCNILSGIGSQILQKLNHLAIFSVYDLLLHLPYRYQDRTRITSIADLRLEHPAVVQGVIVESYWLSGKRRIYHCKIADASGEMVMRFFHMPPFLQKRLFKSQTIKAFGEVKLKVHGFEMIHPELEFLNQEQSSQVPDFFTPWYPSTQGITQSQWRKYIQDVFNQYAKDIAQLEWLSADFLQKLGLPPIDQALQVLHFPTPDLNPEDLMSPLHPARKRLALEELTAFALSSQELKRQNQNQKAPSFPAVKDLRQKLFSQLPFELTQAQQKVVQEIQDDLEKSQPMLRLLQGDVGSGKTIVCALASLGVLAKGYQVALMAPTDLLSEQHYLNIKSWLEPLGFQVRRLNRTTALKEKKQTLKDLEQGDAHFVIGTHALFQDKVKFKQLGLVVIDEQHRFGVVQRLKLVEKGASASYPHQLFVTATPIPRTLAMTQFSHFDLSILDQLPKGRKPVQTAVMSADKREQIIEHLQKTLANKGQIYWVCTRIEQNEEEPQKAAEAIYAYLQTQLPSARIALVHGKLKGIEKEDIMRAFKACEFDVLVATTVIEVGVDVPNANIMIIEDADKLGLSQLHQLRGRVGRGSADAFCILMYQAPISKMSHRRLQTIRQSTDGFWLAEEDMKMRGYGEVLGTQQSGFNEFRIASIPEHSDLLKLGLELSKHFEEKHPFLSQKLLSYWYTDAYKFLKA
jgi:ATP-dependent DNA helicase RecG